MKRQTLVCSMNSGEGSQIIPRGVWQAGARHVKLGARYYETMSTALRGHQRIDQRSLAMHRAIAEKLRLHPGLLEIARENLDRWSATSGRSQPYWDAWRTILDGPLEQVLERMVEESEGMTAMRQATPFAGILSPQERWAIYDRFRPGAE